ncbi:MAG: hypothetical protein P8M78_01470, partial [Myxococcota bacterium]|nr:hypothetical protein [Myxococcota bacterium]
DITNNFLSDTQAYTRTIAMGASTGDQRSLVDLAAFKDLPAEGAWRVEVMNPDPNRTYTLESWSLSLKTEEQQVTTDDEGSYEIPGSLLSFSSVVGPYALAVELPKTQFITTENTVQIGIGNPDPIVDIGVSTRRPLPRVVKVGRVNWRGKLKVKGQVRFGQSVEARTEGVYCRTFRYGRFVCRGRNLEPGLKVAIVLAEPESPERSAFEWLRNQRPRFGRNGG